MEFEPIGDVIDYPVSNCLVLVVDYQHSSLCLLLLVAGCCRVHFKEISIYVFPEKELRGLSPNFHIHTFMCLWAI